MPKAPEADQIAAAQNFLDFACRTWGKSTVGWVLFVVLAFIFVLGGLVFYFQWKKSQDLERELRKQISDKEKELRRYRIRDLTKSHRWTFEEAVAFYDAEPTGGTENA